MTNNLQPAPPSSLFPALFVGQPPKRTTIRCQRAGCRPSRGGRWRRLTVFSRAVTHWLLEKRNGKRRPPNVALANGVQQAIYIDIGFTGTLGEGEFRGNIKFCARRLVGYPVLKRPLSICGVWRMVGLMWQCEEHRSVKMDNNLYCRGLFILVA